MEEDKLTKSDLSKILKLLRRDAEDTWNWNETIRLRRLSKKVDKVLRLM
jgi:hypothetical protein